MHRRSSDELLAFTSPPTIVSEPFARSSPNINTTPTYKIRPPDSQCDNAKMTFIPVEKVDAGFLCSESQFRQANIEKCRSLMISSKQFARLYVKSLAEIASISCLLCMSICAADDLPAFSKFISIHDSSSRKIETKGYERRKKAGFLSFQDKRKMIPQT
ncbi:hypothetical protein EYC84_007701 [Monilinia fructicola]|uniref:Uncharacterized protein n=1 Tax=Monilinia fructicola TaxID=38448 RepID=A0A5M9JJ74_MONFR|nr:hypothetical protein EYC84_007701 [Monilinia fructicola]